MTKPRAREHTDCIRREHVDEALTFFDIFDETFRDFLPRPDPPLPPNNPPTYDDADSYDEPDRDRHPTQP